MTQTVWAHLPNAKHIDWVIASLKVHPKKWATSCLRSMAAWNAFDAARGVARGVARDAVYTAACDAAYDAACDAAGQVLYDVARDAAYDAAWDAALYAVWGTIAALIAYDDCAYMIESEVGELKIIAAFGDPRAILLLPACIVFNETKELA